MAPRFDPRFSRRRFMATWAGAGLAGIAARPAFAQAGRFAPERNADLPGAPPTADMPRKLPPGKSIAYAPARSNQSICSPSLAILAGGTYIASHGLTGVNSSRNRTQVYLSADRGKTWNLLAEIQGQTWTSLFMFGGRLHLFGVEREYGWLVLRIPAEGVLDWKALERRSPSVIRDSVKYVTSPTPVVVHNGRIWKAFEDAAGEGPIGECNRAFVLSAPADPLAIVNDLGWSASNRCDGDPKWLDGTFVGWGDGNVVVTREGKVVNVLRVSRRHPNEKAAIITLSADGMLGNFKPETGFIDFPGGAKKFTIRYDETAKRYWSLTNWVPPKFRSETPGLTCNTLALVSSPDLREWRVDSVILHHPDVPKHGYSHPDWLIDGDDLVAVVQTASDDDDTGAPNARDANFLTFHRIRNFRELKLKDSVVDPLTLGVAAAHVEQGWTTPNP